jgi:hypothetical protein
MRGRVADRDTSPTLARYEAQKLAFAPLIFQALRSARDLGVLDCLWGAGEAGATAADVVAKTGLSDYAASLLLEASFAAGLAQYREPRFVITKTGVFWLKDNLTRVNAEFSHQVCYRGAFHFEETMRSGLPAGLRELGPWKTVYEGLSSLPADVKKAWFDFDHFYSDGVFETCLPRVFPSDATRVVNELVDIGGNTGRFTRMCLEQDARVKVTLVDLPQQIGLAKASLGDTGGRVSFAEANLLDPDAALPKGADVYWMSQFLDCFSEAQIASILRRVRAAMKPGARAFILETFWDKQRHEAARYCVIGTSLYFACIANGCSRMYHSSVMTRLARDAGLSVVGEWHDVGLSHSLLELTAS